MDAAAASSRGLLLMPSIAAAACRPFTVSQTQQARATGVDDGKVRGAVALWVRGGGG
jgi:hypothetical protein